MPSNTLAANKIESKRKRLESLRSQLESERSSFISHWKDLGDHILPRRPRFVVSDANRGERRNQKIIDSTATLAARTLRSGMMGGVTSPARPWFRLTTPDPALAEFGPVKGWLHTISQTMSTIFLRSNVYNVLPVTYGDLGTFATAPMSIEEDFDNVIHSQSFPIGSYMIAKDHRGRVNVFFREFRMTVRQLVEQFGRMSPRTGLADWSNFSDHVRTQWDTGHYETWVDVCHVIQPNPDFNPENPQSKFKRFISCYYEKGYVGDKTSANYLKGSDDERYLRESGYDYFPILCPRWEITGEDVYGTDCPGMTALGDIKALQTMHKRKAQAIEKSVNPPLVGPSELYGQKTSLLPGDITYHSEREGMKGLRPIHEVRPEINGLLLDIQDHQRRIQRAFYEDLFLMLANTDRRQITAREIEERHEEKLMALGPVLEQLNQDLLDPMIDNTFAIMLRQGMVPEPPEELEGMKLKVEYISVMAQAQKLVGISSIERFAGFAGNVAAQTKDPTVLDKIDLDQMLDVYGDLTSVPPGIIRSDDDVAAIRENRARQQQEAAAAEAAKELPRAAKDLAGADLSTENALTKLIRQAEAGQVAPQQ